MLKKKYYRVRSQAWRLKRIFFPSPAELKLITLMGGKVWQSKHIKWPNGFALAIVFSKGKFLREEKMRREVRVGKYFLDFGNDLYYGLEVDGRAYHQDVVAAFDRDSYLYMRGWKVLHIPAIWLWNNPNKVQQQVLGFLLYGKPK
jgi:very-short-patch-repair endonuclease